MNETKKLHFKKRIMWEGAVLFFTKQNLFYYILEMIDNIKS